MQGLPLTQAKKAIAACLGALDAEDLFGLVAFDDKAEPFKRELSESSTENRRAAQKFLDKIESRGGTELACWKPGRTHQRHTQDRNGNPGRKSSGPRPPEVRPKEGPGVPRLAGTLQSLVAAYA
jgi:hypothetical protein